MADTAVHYPAPGICYTGFSDKNTKIENEEAEEEKLTSRFRPLYIFVNNDGGNFALGGNFNRNVVLQLVNFLSMGKVSHEKIYSDQPENVLYGLKGSGDYLFKRRKFC
ncbi:hypothetical protein [Zunongwangia sp. H14]|uniref:hypothetical protein n=1 Tax=Zunongwangia sp. H14 TaxID=3240792 RepID=UPI003568FCBC